jgi:3-deoxy-alpha-D-manno-octulosonate 8-oxidase
MIPEILNTGIKVIKNVNYINFGSGSIKELSNLIKKKKLQSKINERKCIYLLDIYFQNDNNFVSKLNLDSEDILHFIDTAHEPKTNEIDNLLFNLRKNGVVSPCAIIGIGGGITLDTSKAISNLYNNLGKASDFQGWDLLKNPGVFKIGIPTISGTGSEATRTCVMTNENNGLKLGMNSDFTVFDHIILDPDLTLTVPKNQYFYTGMDSYIHCIESLNGIYRSEIGDAYSRETVRLCREVFLSENIMSDNNRSKLMVASYLGGCAIASSYVGIIHPLSAALSVVLNIHHCIANCIVMRAMEEFYPNEYNEFWEIADKQSIHVPSGICRNLDNKQYIDLINSTIIHVKPLTNALGTNFRSILTDKKIVELFKMM